MSGKVQYDTSDIYSVALCAWKEARGDGLGACYAVAHVIYNRARDWNKSLHEVVYGKNQFTSMSVPTDPTFNLEPKSDDVSFNTLHNYVIPNVLEGDDDPTYGAHYYYNPRTATSGWFVRNIVQKPEEHPKTVTIGHHEFFV